MLDGGGGQVVHDLTPEGLAAVLERWSSLTPDDISDKRAAAGRAFQAWQNQQAGANVLDLALRGIGAADTSVRRPLRPRLKQAVEHLSPGLYRSASRAKSFATVGLRPRATVFGSIYSNNRWGSSVSRSGTGSDLRQTSALREALPKLLGELDCRVLLDIPCGDFYWMAQTDVDLDKYVGADIVSSLIEANEREFGRDDRIFTQLDLTSGPLPIADVVLCRDGLVHLAYQDVFRALDTIRQSGSTYLLTTTFVGRSRNHDVLTGAWRPLNLQLPPFSFPPPLRIVDERCTEGGGRFADKSLGLWRISDLNVNRSRPHHR
ncbi:MAG: class I SAM-dependent methyltransferase [Actinomycetota bacterium]|nr:class I SAM-dependent methyltransferase [Actinomycetota bacterium]